MNSPYGKYKKTLAWSFGLITLVLAVGVTAMQIERPSQSAQLGYRGTGMALIANTASLAADAPIHQAPEIHKPARVRPGGPIAGQSYKNVQVLTELSIGEFGRTMTAMSEWVAPKESCSYCHVDGDFASDGKYTKVVARRMLEMVRHLNTTWKPHTGETGVTCYTCHRGSPLPQQRWFKPAAVVSAGLFQRRGPDATAAPSATLAVLPNDPLLDFLAKPVGGDSIRVISTSMNGDGAGPRASMQNAEKTYGLMLHVSKSLGVNCTFCHNSRALASWSQSTPQRSTAWYGIQMVRDLNNQFLEPLGGVFPAAPAGRLGPSGDAAKISCATCHMGTNKPLKGAQMARFYPALLTPYAVPAPAAASAPVPSAATAAATAAAAAAATAAAAAASAPAAAASAPENAASSPLELMARAPAPPAPPTPPTSATPVAASAPVSVAVAPVARPTPPPVVMAAVAEPPNCIDIGASGSKGGARVAQTAALRQVSGSGRLAFFSAPDKGCEMLGTYIQPGEVVEASVDHGGYTAVRYQRAQSGIEVKGWVRTERLALAAKSAPLVAAAAAAAAGPGPGALPAPALAPATASVPASAPGSIPGTAPGSAPARVLASAAPEPCRGAEAATGAGRQPVAPAAAHRVVVGAGRLQFYAAPQGGCPQNGVFILPGEAVEAVEQLGDYTVVRYRNPRNGNEARGWVQSARLAAAPTRPTGAATTAMNAER